MADIPAFQPFTEQSRLNWYDEIVPDSRFCRGKSCAFTTGKGLGEGQPPKCSSGNRRVLNVWEETTVFCTVTCSCFHISSSFSFVSCSVSSSHPPPPPVLIPYIFPCSSSCLCFSCSLPHSLVCLSSPLQPHTPSSAANLPHIFFSFPYFHLSSSLPYFTCLSYCYCDYYFYYYFCRYINPLSTQLNLICHLLALLGAHLILHVSRIRVNSYSTFSYYYIFHILHLICSLQLSLCSLPALVLEFLVYVSNTTCFDLLL